MPEKKYLTDVAIVGAGPAGLFAAFECGTLGMKCHIIDSLEHIGGQCTALYPEKSIYDIPGYPSISAGELIEKLEKQVHPFAPVYHLNQTVETLKRGDDGYYEARTSNGAVIQCKAVIIAVGAGAFGPNRPPIDDLTSYEGKSVFYMVRRREDFAGKTLVIAGGGDSAVDWAVSLADIARKIYFVHRRDKFRATPESVEKLETIVKTGKIEKVIPYQLHELTGSNGFLKTVELTGLDDRKKTIEADVLLPFFGLAPQLGVIAGWGIHTDNHRIPVDQSTQQTNLAGVFAIGDVAVYPRKLKLILTGFSEAAIAAHAIYPLVFQGKELHFVYSTTKGVP
ncbi:MAG: NAD(P)/FAD-dependent oxidoreductase [Alphaproteobacteria bacterium]|nr:NAD(P)/FAD-dependent oxidoreductase [Alphaproteobacteria bacterium]